MIFFHSGIFKMSWRKNKMPGTERKCRLCDETTREPLTDFADIGWYAFKIGRMKSICFCPMHKDQVMKVFGEEWGKQYDKV